MSEFQSAEYFFAHNFKEGLEDIRHIALSVTFMPHENPY